MNINKGALIAMKKKLKILYTLIRKTILGKVMKVKSCYEESSHQNYQDSVFSEEYSLTQR